MNILADILKACVVCITVLTQLSAQDVICPKHPGSDPNDVNARIQKLAEQKTYYQEDAEYRYKITICQQLSGDNVAIQQFGKKWDEKRKWITVGGYDHASVTGGTDWLMITYPGGDKYNSHCKQLSRQGVLTITCDPGVKRGELKVIEEFRTNATVTASMSSKPFECYYLFELNNDAACTVQPSHLSPGSILLIIIAVVGTVYVVLGFLYQRFVVGAKGLEQIPNYSFWTDCGSLQADGCNFICRCTEAQTTRYKTMDDILADDDKDDTLLPM